MCVERDASVSAAGSVRSALRAALLRARRCGDAICSACTKCAAGTDGRFWRCRYYTLTFHLQSDISAWYSAPGVNVTAAAARFVRALETDVQLAVRSVAPAGSSPAVALQSLSRAAESGTAALQLTAVLRLSVQAEAGAFGLPADAAAAEAAAADAAAGAARRRLLAVSVSTEAHLKALYAALIPQLVLIHLCSSAGR